MLAHSAAEHHEYSSQCRSVSVLHSIYSELVTTSATTSARLLRLLSLLQSRRDWPGALLAERLQVSDRTVRRDVDRLRELGYSIHTTMGPDGGYHLDAGSELPPMLFDDEQAVALAIALQSATMIGAGIEESALRALTTVRQVLPSRLRHTVDALRLTTLPEHVTGASAETLVSVSMAIRDRLVLRYDYSSPGGTPDTGRESPEAARRVEPHHAIVARGLWYLVAWDLDRSDWRIFRIDRMSLRTPAGPRFSPRAIPGGDVPRFVSGRFKGATVGDEWPCRGTVILALPASAVLRFARDGVVDALGETECSVTLGSWSWGSLAASFARFEAPMRVVDQPELSAAFAELAERCAAVGEHPVRIQEASAPAHH